MTDKLTSPEIEITNPAGLHARPAAVFASKAKLFKSDIKIFMKGKGANAKSVVGIMGLSTKKGDQIHLEASGEDADQAIKDLTQLLIDRCGEAEEEAPAPQDGTKTVPTQLETDTLLTGVAASPGIAIGRVFQYWITEFDVPEQSEDLQTEKEALSKALKTAHLQIEEIKKNLTDAAKIDIMTAHQELLQDPDLLEEADTVLKNNKTAAFAWKKAFNAYSSHLEAQENTLLRERANDIRDIGRRVLSILMGKPTNSLVIPEQSILIAEDLTPSDTIALDPKKVVGFCTRTGGATSHVAILARSLGIPALCGASKKVLSVKDNSLVIIDGTLGTLNIAPDEGQLQQARQKIERAIKRKAEDSAMAHIEARTSDQVRIEVAANIRNVQDAQEAIKRGAEGIGLLRTEFLFDERTTAPTEQEQSREYKAVAETLGKERILVVRTLDVGGDKPLSYLPLPHEDNPFLGMRGIRIGLANPEILRVQLRAILSAAPFSRLHIMFPMIASLEELRMVKAILKEEQEKSGCASVKTGIMIEVPSAALLAEHFAQEVDFFSIGTNDLTQYTLAMDRGHPDLAKQADALHPGVLSLISMTCRGAQNYGKWVGVCGGLASEELAVPLLVGLGVTELSVSIPVIATIKALLSRWSLKECQELAQQVLTLGTTSEIRALLANKAR